MVIGRQKKLLQRDHVEKANIESTCSNDACYTVHLNKTAFTDAHVECTNRGGDLVTIQNEEEAGHVHSLLWKLTSSAPLVRPLKLWIGLQLKLKSCVVRNETLKGFSWITDNEDAKEGQFSNWLTEPKATCTKRKCVSMKLQKDSPDNYKWSDELCSFHADGYICKFNFEGMCQRVVLAGPGSVEYDTPFGFKISSLDLVPYGSSASVSCGHNGEHTRHLLLCLKSDETNSYQWGNSRLDKKSNGPFCASEKLSCKYKNGGCEHECVEFPLNKSLSCRCKDGYVLAPDLVSCVLPDHCQSNPCEQKCINHQYGFECSCFNGFALAENQVSCYNIKGCLKGECDPRIINGYKTEGLELESNDTTSSILKENDPDQTSPHTFINGQNDNGNTPKITQPTLKPSVETASPGANVKERFRLNSLLQYNRIVAAYSAKLNKDKIPSVGGRNAASYVGSMSLFGMRSGRLRPMFRIAIS
ncbi:complement component C1q receptor-like [Bufo gargarizans]|uniref:complement component C1q receptor-like n=1 Tax=Bufo gargarizans TaxID=30331 RepID=UPI001CF1F3CE|nr:complement component C1q receptor-like [Bufo gargarizans]